MTVGRVEVAIEEKCCVEVERGSVSLCGVKAMAPTELHVTVLAANGLMRDGGLRAMSVYSLLWIDHALKLSTRVHCEGGRHPVWNDELVFNLGEDELQFPHSAITIKVVSEGRSEGSRTNTLLGTAYLPLAEIARIKAMKENPEDPDILQLQLTTPSGHVQGYISLSISLIDSSQRWCLSVMAPLLSNQSMQPVIGYPMGLLSSSDMEAHVAANFQANSSSGWDFPVLSQSGGVLYYPPGQEGSSAYIQTPQPYCPCMGEITRRQRHRNIVLAVIGGAVAGFVIGDVLGVFFR